MARFVMLIATLLMIGCARDRTDTSVHVPGHAPYHEGDNNASIIRAWK